MKRFLAPRWIAGHLLAIATVVAFVFFGFWQLDRHDQKREIKDGVEEAAALAPEPLLEVEGDPTFRVLRAGGTYDTDYEFLVLRSQSGTSGYLVVTPLVLGDGTAILVDRGWVPLDYDTAPVAPAAPPEAEVSVTGQLWPGTPGSALESLPDVMKRIDPVEVGRLTPYPVREGYYMVLFDQTPATGGEILMPPDRPETSLGPHLGYAGQWFLFAAVVLVGYPLLLRRRLRD